MQPPPQPPPQPQPLCPGRTATNPSSLYRLPQPTQPHACRRAERYDWTDDQIWSIITNEGRSVDPFVMLNAPTFQTLNPLCMPDWAGQGIEYVDEMEDWVSQEGRWMSQAEYANVEALYRDIDEDDDDEDIMEVRLLQPQPLELPPLSTLSVPLHYRTPLHYRLLRIILPGRNPSTVCMRSMRQCLAEHGLGYFLRLE